MLIGVVAVVRNEESIVGEWLAFHRSLGFDRIHVLDNLSTDRTRAIVRQASHSVGGITCETWQSGDDFNAMQIHGYNRGLEVMRADGVEWCLFIDADEFLVCTSAETVRDFLARRDENAAIALHWSFYGSSGHQGEPPGLVTENFLWRAPANFHPQSLCKSFIRVPYVQGCINGHMFKLDETCFPYVDCGGSPVQWESQGQDHAIWPWRINHYFVRSGEWWAKKIARAKDVVGLHRLDHEWHYYDRNDEYDPAASKYGIAVRKALSDMGLPVPPQQEQPFTRHFFDYCVKRGVFAGAS